jgi:DNA-directed RNA polymerase subunit RPC12/RpoP
MAMSSKNQIIQQVHYARMRVISKPPDQTRQAARDVGPVIKGDGNTTYLCGDCETTVLETVEYKLVRDLVVKCKRCGCTNDIPPLPSRASTLFHVQLRHLRPSGV